MNRRALLSAHAKLAKQYGPIGFKPGGDPLAQLVQTILSQNTSDVNSDRAYKSLRKRFPTWESVMNAPTRQIADSIRQRGLANIKAPRIKETLRIILKREGRLSLARIRRMRNAEAMDYLTSIKGVGVKTAACVLLFALGRPVMPVDTHVHRVTRRLGWVPEKARPDDIGPVLEHHLPDKQILSMHIYLVWHGRKTCKAQHPLCAECSLAKQCAFGRKHKDSQ